MTLSGTAAGTSWAGVYLYNATNTNALYSAGGTITLRTNDGIQLTNSNILSSGGQAFNAILNSDADANGDGPAHRGMVGRRAGALQDFDYSPALRSSKLLWTRATLRAWLTDPETLIPGQGMDYSLDDAREREDVVAYLATLKRPTANPGAR